MLEQVTEELEELAPVEVNLATEDGASGAFVPVTLRP